MKVFTLDTEISFKVLYASWTSRKPTIGLIRSFSCIFFRGWVLDIDGGNGFKNVYRTAHFPILINGAPKGFFPAQKGLYVN